ncbi:terminase large subunit domain-containing protein [Halorhodospira sp. 9622]|uniref:terminase large subunit domain-containing protein n=1 Tax=Halorhodospira sp. 9622 TaxID=2899136 RepID=UPI001EE7AB65|nr:terminase family protein [Halorhodospira sp. 9622]MCG5537868.1 terminase large subunit [Halorhodospira sp. 9622]
MQQVLDPSFIEGLSPLERRAILAQIDEELAQERLADYRPYAKQREFHAAGASFRERLLRAGNQQGKTFATGAEVAYHLTGEYPDWWPGRRWDRPVVVWASGETGETTRDNGQRVLLGHPGEEGTGLVPKRCLTSDYGMAAGVSHLYDYIRVKHASGGYSFLRFRYYAQGRRKWQGPPVDFVWYDEEPPEDIYDEGLARTIATGGIVALSFTPLMGMSSVVSRYLMEGSDQRHDTNMTIHDAEHIDAEERQRIIASFPAHEREARAHGIPTLGSGRIFPIAEEEISVEPFTVPAIWPVIGGLDFGWDHPTAAAKIVWDRDSDTIYVTNGYRKSQATPVIHAAALKPWGARLPWAWPHDGYQTEKGSGVQLAEQYREQGLNMLPTHAAFPETRDDTRLSRTSVEAGLAEMLDRMQTGRFKVFSHLTDWFEEFRLYHRKDGKIVKERDDLIDATRYAMMMLRHAEPPSASAGTTVARPAPDWRV